MGVVGLRHLQGGLRLTDGFFKPLPEHVERQRFLHVLLKVLLRVPFVRWQIVVFEVQVHHRGVGLGVGIDDRAQSLVVG